MEIKEWIVGWFEEHGSADKKEIMENSSCNYFEKGYIDSFNFIFLISDIEANYNIKFNNDQFVDRSFATIDGLAEIIKNTCEGK